MIIIYSKSNIFDIKIIELSSLIMFTFNSLINKTLYMLIIFY